MLAPKLGGWLPDSKQPNVDPNKDYKFIDLIPKLSVQEPDIINVVDLRKFCSPVENQSVLSSCVGNATVGALEMLQIREGKPFVNLSRLFIYYNARLVTGDTDKDAGTYIRLAFTTLTTLGTCSETECPYDISRVFIRPSWNSYKEAYANKISSFYSIDGYGIDRINSIKLALASQHPVVFGALVTQGFVDTDSSGIIAMPKNNVTTIGGHAMMICGYDDNRKVFIVRNSWGPMWGDKGYCYIPMEALDAMDANDFWVPTYY